MNDRRFCNATQCSPVANNQHFGETVCILLRGKIMLSLCLDKPKISQEVWTIIKPMLLCLLLLFKPFLVELSCLKKLLSSRRTSWRVDGYQNTTLNYISSILFSVSCTQNTILHHHKLSSFGYYGGRQTDRHRQTDICTGQIMHFLYHTSCEQHMNKWHETGATANCIST